MDISIALGGGGAKGNAHIGVLRVLEREGFRIRAVAGTSFGGIVAALYAGGLSPAQIEDEFARIDQASLYGHRPGDNPSLLGLAGADAWLVDIFGERNFADLKIPCALTAVDLRSGREVVLRQGRVRDAVLATIALPGIFPARTQGDFELIDGGVLDPVPVRPARDLAPGLAVVAVSLSDPIGDPSQMISLEIPGLPDPLQQGLFRLRFGQAMAVFLRSVEISQRMLTQLRLEADAPDVTIHPDVGHIKLLDRVDVRVVARLGDRAAETALPELRRAVAWHRRLGRQLRLGQKK